MSIIEKLEQFKLSDRKNKVEYEYLNEPVFITTLNNALVDLYKTKPVNPVTYLAKYLLNESKAKVIEEEISIRQKEKLSSIEVFNIKEKEKEEKNALIRAELDKELDKRKKLMEFIESSVDLENDLTFISNTLKEIIKATGVYFSFKEKKRKFVNKEDDEKAHLEDYDVIRIVSYDDESAFLKHQCIEPTEGITNNLFLSEEDANQDNQDPESQNQTTIRKNMENVINHIYEPEVIRNDKIKFFKEPRLGCYLALDLRFKSSLSTESLKSSLEKWEEYLGEKNEIEQRKQEKEERLKELEKDRELAGEEGEIADPDNNVSAVREEVANLKDYETENRYLILSLDTLGQDRMLSEEEKAYLFQVGKQIQNSWFELEKRLLLKDRDLRIEFKEKEAAFLNEYNEQKFKEEEDKHYKDYLFAKYEDK